MAGVDKVGLSLDEIIKLNKNSRGRGRGRGKGGRGGRGLSRGFGTSGTRRGFGIRRVVRGGVIKRGAGRRGRRGGAQFSTPRQLPDVWQHDMFEGAVVRQRGRGRGSFGVAVGNTGSSNLLISNLDWGVNDADIVELFGEFGALRKAAIHYDRSGRSLGTAEVVFERPADALRAMKQYNNVPLGGRTMRIQMVGVSAAVNFATNGSAQVRRGTARRGRGFGGFRAGGMQRSNVFGRRGAASFRRGGGRGRGRGRGGRGGRGGLAPSKDQLDAQLDDYNKKMDME